MNPNKVYWILFMATDAMPSTITRGIDTPAYAEVFMSDNPQELIDAMANEFHVKVPQPHLPTVVDLVDGSQSTEHFFESNDSIVPNSPFIIRRYVQRAN